jgi:hypothetical protein
MSEELTPRIIHLPGTKPATVDANIIVCTRQENYEEGWYVAVHTNQGFAFGVFPPEKQEIGNFHKEINAIIWPEEKVPKKRR